MTPNLFEMAIERTKRNVEVMNAYINGAEIEFCSISEVDDNVLGRLSNPLLELGFFRVSH